MPLILSAAAAFLIGVMALAWLVRMRTGQSGWIDALWSMGTGAAAVLAVLLSGQETRHLLVAALIGLWSLRLGTHSARRAATAERDDPRYARLAEEWGAAFPRRLFLFLQIQALCGLGLVVTALAAATAPRGGIDARDLIGVAIALTAIAGEGIADGQLRRFAARNPGGVCDVGLWRWSRHPNYFFEWLAWLAYPVIALTPGHALGWASLIGPLLIYWLLVHASGIPPLERHMLASRGEAFRAYMRRTSAFFPMPPRERP